MYEKYAIGLMSGTSVDSIDAALVEFRDGDTVEIIKISGISVPVQPKAKELIFDLFEDQAGTLKNLVLANSVLGELFAEAASELMSVTGVIPEQIEVIGSHGQTVYHVAEKNALCGMEVRGSLQIGEGSVIAQRTGVPVVSDFRPGDIAAGGSGAPLIPFLDRILASKFGNRTAFQNIGGIGNVCYFPEPGSDPVAFDTGPGNMIADRLAGIYSGGSLDFDKNGTIGGKGTVDRELLAEWMKHPYFSRKPPKSTGREDFGTRFFNDYLKDLKVDENLIRTAEEFTALSIADSYRTHLESVPEMVIVAGGGGHNHVIMEALGKYLPESRIITAEAAGISTDYKEAAAFALMGYFALKGRTNNVPSATGAEKNAVMGKLSLP